MKTFDIPFPLATSALLHRSYVEALDILRIVNCAPAQNWTIHLGDKSDERHYEILLPVDCDINSVMNCVTPWMPSFKSIAINDVEGNWIHTFEDQEFEQTGPAKLSFIKCPTGGGHKQTQITIVGKNLSPLEREWTDRKEIQTFLARQTWLGSSKYRSAKRGLTIFVGPTRFHFLSSDVQGEEKPIFEMRKQSKRFQQNSISFLYSKRSTDKDAVFRLSESGVVSPEDRELLNRALLGAKLLSGCFEIEYHSASSPLGGRRSMTEFHDDEFREFIEFIGSVDTSLKYKTYLAALTAEREESAALELDRRKTDLMHCDYVYYGGTLVYKVPRNENEVISLHQKLEGMSAIPLKMFVSLEFTPQLGIDAIASFRVRDGDSTHSFAGVEFEYRLDSFFKHQHPAGQTDLIICWDITTSNTIQPVRDKKHSWLYYLNMDTKKLPAVCVRDYPGITISKLEKK